MKKLGLLLLVFAGVAFADDTTLPNGDLSEDLSMWHGDMEAGTDASLDAASSGIMTINLHGATWTKATREITDLFKYNIVRITFSFSSDIHFSDHSEDYQNVAGQLNLPVLTNNTFNGSIITSTTPGSSTQRGTIMLAVVDTRIQNSAFAFCQVKEDSTEQTCEFPISRVRSSNPNEKTFTLTFGFPPGHGTISVKSIVLSNQMPSSRRFPNYPNINPNGAPHPPPSQQRSQPQTNQSWPPPPM